MDPADLRARMYGPEDLAAEPLFAGGFINFGFWSSIPLDRRLDVGHRIASQRRLYEVALDTLGPCHDTRLLEVGCGRGLGSALAATAYGVPEVHAIDLHPDQVERARRTNARTVAAMDGRLVYRQGAANTIPYPDGYFDRLLSVEAAQHFDDIPGFAHEALRVLLPHGRLVVTTFFATGEGHKDRIAEMLATFRTGVDRAIPVGTMTGALRAAGFVEVTARSIGEHVWPGLDRWQAQQDRYARHWSRNWLTAFRRGLLDYYMVTAQAPG
ncbi:hypothetical protein GCM10012275_55240 [Longimycelium tulufanense]|uniref:Methyltransferase type 11 domain-containing protein n=1 Tax=Longimycelium tulufanense TaxID=907463 RepID=A0A8J3CDD0_9PSEU|nr:class I SAM-dependent methyltransferase [Longimycelium tulufanense]GGM77476.1 hypothetical protein GCM10012275_55240 [Longimycelium tulufanense]